MIFTNKRYLKTSVLDLYTVEYKCILLFQNVSKIYPKPPSERVVLEVGNQIVEGRLSTALHSRTGRALARTPSDPASNSSPTALDPGGPGSMSHLHPGLQCPCVKNVDQEFCQVPTISEDTKAWRWEKYNGGGFL